MFFSPEGRRQRACTRIRMPARPRTRAAAPTYVPTWLERLCRAEVAEDEQVRVEVDEHVLLVYRRQPSPLNPSGWCHARERCV